MTHPLLVWLEERLAEAERIARAAEEKAVSPWTFNDMGDVADAHHEEVLPTDGGYYGQGEAVAEHVALHDPAAGLADIAAKRAIIEYHQAFPDGEYCQVCELAAFPCETVRLLASAYAREPGYREEWRPS